MDGSKQFFETYFVIFQNIAAATQTNNTVEIGYCDYHLVTKMGYYDYLSTLFWVFDTIVYITL